MRPAWFTFNLHGRTVDVTLSSWNAANHGARGCRLSHFDCLDQSASRDTFAHEPFDKLNFKPPSTTSSNTLMPRGCCPTSRPRHADTLDRCCRAGRCRLGAVAWRRRLGRDYWPFAAQEGSICRDAGGSVGGVAGNGTRAPRGRAARWARGSTRTTGTMVGSAQDTQLHY